jgi:hypothetical protein
MAIYSTQFAAGVMGTAGPNLVYTVPVGKRAVLRGMDGFLYTGAVFVLLLSLNGNPPCIGAVASAAQPVSGIGSWAGYQVLNAGDQVFLAGNNAGISFILSGYLFDVP